MRKISMPFVLMLFTINVYAQNDVDCYKGDCLNGFGIENLSNGNRYYGFYENGEKVGVGISANESGDSRHFTCFDEGKQEGLQVSVHWENGVIDRIYFKFYGYGGVRYPVIKLRPNESNTRKSLTAKFFKGGSYKEVTDATLKAAYIRDDDNSKHVKMIEKNYESTYDVIAVIGSHTLYGFKIGGNNFISLYNSHKATNSSYNNHTFKIYKNGDILSENIKTGEKIFLASGSNFPNVKHHDSYFTYTDGWVKHPFVEFFNNEINDSEDNLFYNAF